jgi:aldose 1-epimerase
MTVALNAGTLRLELEPQLGGAVGAFVLARPEGDFDLMRPLRGAKQSLRSGMFPMVPFANCIRDNTFAFGGRHYRVSPNMEGARLNFHGSGWLSEWLSTEVTDTSARLLLDDGRVDDVYRYAANQLFALDPQGLEVTLSVTNRGTVAMPFGFGLHPWFPTHDEALVTFEAAEILRGDPDGQLIAREPVTPATDYSTPRQPPTDYLNVCYAGWDGTAAIEWPSSGVRLALDADPVFPHLMAHVPADREPVFCLEPQSNAPCGFDGLGADALPVGVHVLQPGESLAGTVRFRVQL